MNYSFNTRNLAIACVTAIIVWVTFVIGCVYGNTAAAESTEHIAVACVSHGGKWEAATADCLR